MPAETTTEQTTTSSASPDTQAQASSTPTPATQGAQAGSSSSSNQDHMQSATQKALDAWAKFQGKDAPPAAPAKQEGAADEAADAGEPKDEAESADGTADTKGKDAASDIKASADYQKALQALRRYRYPKHLIDNMKPETVIEIGLDAAAAQADNDRRYNQLLNQGKQGKSQTPPAGQNQNAGNTTTSAGQPADGATADPNGQPASRGAADATNPAGAKPWEGLVADLKADAVFAPVAPKLEGAFQAMQSHFDQQLQQLQGSMAGQLERAQQSLTAVSLQLDEANLGRARAELATQYDVLDSDENWQAVEDRAYALADTGKYTKDGKTDWQRLVKDATRLEFGDAIEKQQKTTTRRQFDQQAAGQVTSRDTRRTPNKALTPEQKMQVALAQLGQGVKPDDVARSLAVG